MFSGVFLCSCWAKIGSFLTFDSTEVVWNLYLAVFVGNFESDAGSNSRLIVLTEVLKSLDLVPYNNVIYSPAYHLHGGVVCADHCGVIAAI